jgi:catechol 2,3-dioxygenase-like lactoylglutathione lyase family enzyme
MVQSECIDDSEWVAVGSKEVHMSRIQLALNVDDIEAATAFYQGGTLNHLGVEVQDVDTVDAEQTRLAAAGLASVDERGTTCCYAKQDKFWVEGAPNGERWEIYTVLADSATFFAASADDAPGCCGTSAASAATTDTEQAPQPAVCC